MSLNRFWRVGLLAATFLAAPAWAQTNAFFFNCPATSGSAGTSVSCSVLLNLTANSTPADSMDFTVAVASANGPAITSPKVRYLDSVNTANAAACQNTCVPTTGNPFANEVSVLYSAIDNANTGNATVLTTGNTTLGTVTFTIPATAAAGNTYTLSFTGSEVECCNATTESDVQSEPSSSATATITVVNLLTITSPANGGTVTATAGQNVSLQVVTSGGQPPIKFTALASPWPAGFSINSTGLITGTLSPTATNISNLSVTATDSTTPTAETNTSTFNLSVSPALSLAPAAGALPTGTENAVYPTQTITATGGLAPFTWSISAGSLPAGLTLNTASNTSSTTISGTPTAAATNQSVTVQVQDANGATKTVTYTITVNGPLQVTTASVPAGDVQTAYLNAGSAVTLAASGGTPPYTWAVSGTSAAQLPSGLTLTPGTGVISGTPTTANNPGGASVTFTVTDKANATANATFPIVIYPQLTITGPTSPLPSATVQNPYLPGGLMETINSTGGSGTNTWTISAGALPGGLTLTGSGATATITGTPTTAVGSPFSFTVKVTDTVTGGVATMAYSLTVTQGPVISPNPLASLPGATSGIAYSYNGLTVSGGSPGAGYTWTQTGLPAGLSIAGTGTNNATGSITGTTSAVGGPVTVTITVKDANQAQAQLITAITVYAAPTLPGTITLPVATVSSAYNNTTALPNSLSGTGAPAIVWSITNGSLPTGLSLSNAGAITGTPTAVPGTNPDTFTVQAKDANGAIATATASLMVDPALLISGSDIAGGAVTKSFALPPATQNGAYTPGGLVTDTVALAATGGSGTYSTWALSAGSLPNGLSINGATGVISGTPTVSGSFTPSFTVTDNTGAVSPAQQFTLTVNPAIKISSTTNPIPGITANSPYTPGGNPYVFTASGGTGTLTFSIGATPAPPAGLSISGTGTLSANIAATGPVSFDVVATDSNGATGNMVFNATVYAAPSITGPATLPIATVNSVYQNTGVQVVETGGAPAIKYSATGLPNGMTIGAGTGLIGGTPTTNAGSPLSVTVKATDNNGVVASMAYTLTVDSTLVITPATLPTGIQGVVYPSTAVSVSGGSGAGLALTVTGLPAGLTFNGTNITGTPTVNGSFTVTITGSDNTGAQLVAKPTLVITPPLSLVGGALTPANVGSNYNVTIVPTGGSPPYTFSITGLPTGLTYSSSTGAITGTPTTSIGSPFTIQVTVTDHSNTVVKANFTLIVTAVPLGISNNGLPNGEVGVPYQFTELFPVGGVGPYTWSITGLPPGITTDGNGNLRGTPTSAAGSPYSVVVTITDSTQTTFTKTFPVTIVNPVSITGPSSLPAATLNSAYTSTTIATSGGETPLTFTATGLPAGLTIGPVTGAISGTPTTAAGSPYTVTVTVQDGAAQTATKTYTLTVNSPLTISGPASLPNGMVGTAYTSTTVTATGGAGNYTFTATGLPSGLTIGSTSGAITGTPAATSAGTDTVTVTVTDSSGATATKNYTVTISPAQSGLPIITSISTAAGYQTVIAPNTWVGIYGTNFASAGFTDNWNHLLTSSTTQLPTALDGISVMIGGVPAYVQYVSATQINVLTPNIGFGPLAVTVTVTQTGTGSVTSAAMMINSQTTIPGFFPWPSSCDPQNGTCQPVASHFDYSLAAAPGTFPNITTVPAAPGESIILWGSGFGPTSPAYPFGVAVPTTPTFNTSSNVTAMLNGVPVTVASNIATLTPANGGLYQMVITVPATLPNGSYPLTVTIGGVTTPTYMLTVHN